MTFTVLSYQMIKNNWDAEKKTFSYLHRPISKKIQVHVFPKQVPLWMWRVKFLSSHEEVACKIIP